MLDNLRTFEKELLSLEVGDMIWDQDQKEWYLVLNIESCMLRNKHVKVMSGLEISTNKKACFPFGEDFCSFKEGGKIIKGSTAV